MGRASGGFKGEAQPMMNVQRMGRGKYPAGLSRKS